VTQLIWSFAPWIVFLLTSRFGNVYVAVGAGLLVGVVVLLRALLRHRVHMLDIVSPAYFAALGLVLVIVHPSDSDTWGKFAQAGSHAALTIIVFASLLVGKPFTESYARETVPQEFWGNERFKSVNRRVSAVWGLAFLVGTISLGIAGAVDGLTIILRIVVPFGALYLAYMYTEKQRHAPDEAPG
jgi:intracellular septation protein A